MKKVIIKKKMLYALLIPYIALGFIATIVFAKIYANSIDVINSEVMGNSYGTINKISKEIDYLVEDIERLVIEIGSNTRFRKMLSIEKEDRSKVDNYNIAMGIDELRKINKYNRLIENLSLYYHNGDFCINIESIRTVQGLLEDYDFNEAITDEEWKKIIVSQYDKPQIINAGGQILYIATIPINEEIERSNIIIQIEGKGFKQLINKYTSFNEGELYIFNRNNEVILTNQENVAVDKKLYERIEKYGERITKGGLTYQNIKLNDKKYTMIQVDDKTNELQYVWMIEDSKIYQKSEYIRQSFVGIVIAFSVILFMGLYGVKINYEQIRMVIDRLYNHNLGIPANCSTTEVGFINSAINNLEQRIESQTGIVIEDMIRKALYGLIEKGDEAYTVLANKGEEIFIQESVIAIFEFVGKEDAKAKELKLNRFVLENVMREVFNYKVKFEIIGVHNWKVVILNNILIEEFGSVDYILDGLERIRIFLATQLELNYTIGVSSPILGIENFANGYKEAIEAIQEKAIIGNNRTIYYGNLEEHRNGYKYDSNIHKQILNYIHMGEKEKVSEVIERIFETNFKEHQISLEEAKLIILDILSTLEQLAKDMDYTMQGRVLDVLKDKYTIEEMCEKIRLDIDVLCTYFIEEYIDENDKKTKIIKYIEKNYQDVNLNVGMVARYLDFNPSYLSRFFKEQTNENLLTYINGYRIDKAKEFLRTTNKTLKVIAAETGFIDSAALSRAFKKYEAITPSQYKNIYGKDLK